MCTTVYRSILYLTAAIVSGLAFLALGMYLRDLTPAIGASGAVIAVLVLYATHYPRQVIRIWGILPIEIRWLVGIYIVYDLYPVLLALGGSQVNDGVAHSAHLGGLAFGFLYRKYNLNLSRMLGRVKLPRLDRRLGSRRNIKIHRPTRDEPAPGLDAQVDVILAKVHEQGESSLTSREREILKAASRRYKKR